MSLMLLCDEVICLSPSGHCALISNGDSTAMSLMREANICPLMPHVTPSQGKHRPQQATCAKKPKLSTLASRSHQLQGAADQLIRSTRFPGGPTLMEFLTVPKTSP
jgi:hypothetical protein